MTVMEANIDVAMNHDDTIYQAPDAFARFFLDLARHTSAMVFLRLETGTAREA